MTDTLQNVKNANKNADKNAGKNMANERAKFRAAHNLPNTSVDAAKVVGGALIFSTTPIGALLTASKPDATAAVTYNAAVAALPPFVGAFVRQWAAYVSNAETGLKSIRDITIPDGFGLLSGRNPAQIVEDRLSARASSGDVRKIAVAMLSAK